MGDFKNGSSIPPRWLNCPRKGQLIADIFMPFKTPLSTSFNDEVPEENRFTPTLFIASLKNQNVKMGLWIDLTNTSRFYDKRDVENTGMKYVKLQCRGHGECPSEEQTATFIRLCNSFKSSHPLEIIGVHCTHGFNRTGFLIVAYLVEILNWGVDAAVEVFARFRPPGIYKKDYLQKLFHRFGDPADTPLPPELPDWCNEFDDSVDDDGLEIKRENGSSEQRNPKKRKREFNKKNPTFMEGVPGVVPVLTQPKLGQIQAKCQELCHWKSAGFPGSQPVSMDNMNLQYLAQKPYKVSWKADGTRYMMLIDGENQIFFIDRDNAVFQVAHLRFPHRKNPDQHLTNTLLDGEMIIDKVEGRDVPRYLVYDIIKFEGQEVGGTDFDRRLLCIGKEIIKPRHEAMQSGLIDKLKEPFSVRRKDFWDAHYAATLLSPEFTKNLPHEVDGLIFQPVPDPYKCGQSPCVLKWKPPSLNSVDFKLILAVEQKPGMLREMKGYLYVGSLNTPYAEMKVTKELKQYDKKIIECSFEDGKWKFMRERTDKSFPNSFNTAQAVCESIRNPVTQEKLLHVIHNFGANRNKRPAPVSNNLQHQEFHQPAPPNKRSHT